MLPPAPAPINGNDLDVFCALQSQSVTQTRAPEVRSRDGVEGEEFGTPLTVFVGDFGEAGEGLGGGFGEESVFVRGGGEESKDAG